MKIKRKIEMAAAANRKYIIRKSPTRKPIACAECDSPVLSIGPAANLLGIKQRRIFRIIEAGAAHFSENQANKVIREGSQR